MPKVSRITRRSALKATAGAIGAASLPLVHVRTAGAAGKLTMGVWDHWVKAANPVLKGIIDEWAEKNKVEVKIDFITSQVDAFRQQRVQLGLFATLLVTWSTTPGWKICILPPDRSQKMPNRGFPSSSPPCSASRS